MKLRKTALLTAILIAMTTAAETAPLVSVTDAVNNGINVSGAASSQDKVTLMILNPGYTAADAANGTDGAVQFFRSGTAGDRYSFDANLKIADDYDGGLFTAVVNVNGTLESTTFTLYPAEDKLEIIRRLNDAASSGTILDEAIQKFSLGTTDLYVNGNKTEIAKAVDAVKASLENGKFPEDVDKVYEYLRGALAVAAYNDSDKSLTVSDGRLLYADTILGLDGTDAYTDYINNLNTAGVSAVNDALLKGSYNTVEDIKKEFEKQVALYVITEYKQNGYGHVETYLDKYKDIYTENGFNLSKVSSLSDKTAFFNALTTSTADSLTALAADFNGYTESTGGSGSSGSGGGGGGVSAGSSVSSKPSNTNNYITPQPFSDLGSVEWAREAIEYLYNNGVVAGKGAGLFAPGDTVTRAEFVQMVSGAFRLAAADGAKSFADVSDGDWFAPAVKAASSLGIVSGMSEEFFAPNELVTREQSAAILLNTANYAGIELGSAEATAFADDSEIFDYAKEGVYILKNAGVISGRENNMFAPKAGMTRAEGARMIYGLLMLDK